MAIKSDTRLGPYEIVSAIGAGGMGEVYRARDPRLKRDIAIKVLPASFSSDPLRLHRFEQEAIAAGALNHPNILAVYDIGQQGGSPYIVSELLDGDTLRERLRSGPLPIRKAVDYAQQIASGLAAAHDKGIIHRDLKPENIFITNDGRVKILDFGLAKLTHFGGSEGSDEVITQTIQSDPGTVLGTVGYMSPEQVRGKPADARSDLFSFGAILYEMLSGKRAFHGESPAETMSAILKEELQELTETNRNVPPALEHIVRHCLEKSPQERFQSARDIAFDLEMVSETSQTSARVQPIAFTFRWRRLLPIFWIISLVLVAVAAFLLGKRGAGSSPRFRTLSYERGSIPNARFTPDGRSVIYDAAWEGRPLKVFSTPAESVQPRALEFEQAHLLAVSRSGDIALGLAGMLGNHLDVRFATLGIAPLAGGAPRELLDNVAEADWGPDGTLAVVHTVNNRDRIEFPTGRVLYETTSWITGVRISPKGDRIAFLEHPVWPDDRGWVAAVDLSGHEQKLTQEYESLVGLAWSPGGDLWFAATQGNEYRSLRAVDLGGHERVVLTVPGTLRLYDIAHDGRVLLSLDNEHVGVKAYAPGQNGERDLSWSGWTIADDISRDNKWLLFDEQSVIAGSSYIVAIRSMEGSPPVRLGHGNGGYFSQNGKWVSTVPLTGEPRIVLLPTGVGAAKDLPVPLEKASFALLSPDDHHVMFGGAEQGHAFRCYVQEIDTGKIRAATPEGVYPCVPSPDGASVAAVNSEGKLAIYSPTTDQARIIPGDTSGLQPIRWCADGGLYVYRNQLPLRILRIDPATGKQTVARELAPTDAAGLIGISPVVLSPDAKAYAYSYRRTLSELYVVEGLK
jgi:eukaryotic-like serine/threonine-protein kinase